MYISLMAIPVPEGNMDAYREWAANSASIFKAHGCLEIVDGWEDFVPIGKQTDFRRAVAAKEGEKIVCSWQIWPDKETLLAAESKLHESDVLDAYGEPPFDNSRLIAGCFESVPSMGREA